jgi:hypothetical protein
MMAGNKFRLTRTAKTKLPSREVSRADNCFQSSGLSKTFGMFVDTCNILLHLVRIDEWMIEQ